MNNYIYKTATAEIQISVSVEWHERLDRSDKDEYNNDHRHERVDRKTQDGRANVALNREVTNVITELEISSPSAEDEYFALEEQIERAELEIKMLECIKLLPPNMRKAIMECEPSKRDLGVGGLGNTPHKQYAADNGLKPYQLTRLLQQAILKLRELMEI